MGLSNAKRCSACKGTGVIKFRHPVSNRPGSVSCSSCNGTGSVS